MTWEPKPRGHKAVAVQTSWAGAFLGEGTAGTGGGGTGVPQGTAGLEQSKQLREAGRSRGPWNGGGLSVC